VDRDYTLADPDTQNHHGILAALWRRLERRVGRALYPFGSINQSFDLIRAA